MADNTPQNGVANIATDDLATINGGAVGTAVEVQRVKVGYGSDGDFRDADLTHGIPVQSQQATTGAITTPAGVTGTTSFVALASNTARRTASFYNDTNVDILLALAATSSTTSYSVRVKPGGYYELPGQNLVYTGAVAGLPVAPGTTTATAASSGVLAVTEI